MNAMEILEAGLDPWERLNIPCDAGEKEIERAWRGLDANLQKDPQTSLAYEMIKSSENRALCRLLLPLVPEDLEKTVTSVRRPPRYTGPGIWYKTLDALLEKSDILKSE